MAAWPSIAASAANLCGKTRGRKEEGEEGRKEGRNEMRVLRLPFMRADAIISGLVFKTWIVPTVWLVLSLGF